MAQNINFKGEWLSVPGVNLPKEGGGTAYFADASVTTAGKADVAQGKIFLDAAGQPQTGTNQGGGGTPTLETITKSYTPTESQQTETITPGSGYDGIGEVDVTVGAISSTYVGSGIARRDSTDLQDYDDTVVVPAGYYESQAVGQVALTTHPAPTVSIDANGLITATHAQTAGYVSTNTKTATLQLTKRTSSDLSVNNLTVTAPAGYYPQDATKTATVPTGSATTPATTITANPTITIDPDTGEITAAVSASQSVTPTVSAGYVSAGTAGTVSVSGSATSQMTVLQDSDIIGNILDLSGMLSIRSNNAEVPAGWSPGIFSSQPLFPEAVFGTIDRFGVDSNGQLDVYFKANTAGMAYRTGSYQLTKSNAFQTQGATTITPSTSQQLAVDSSTYTTGQVVVDPIPSQYIVPSGSQTITQNGTVDVTALAEVIVSVAAAGGLEYETGTWTPSSDIARGEISFSKSHTDPPIAVLLADTTGTAHSATNSNYLFAHFNPDGWKGVGFPYSSSGFRYAANWYSYRGTSTSSISSGGLLCSQRSSSSSSSGTNYPKYWATKGGFYPYSNSTSRYWRSGRTYSWIAIWAPTT